MDKKNNKFMSFFKKEGFYVILFVCLCVVATFAAITAKNNAKKATPQASKSNVAMNINDSDKSTTQMPNAEQVKKTTDNKANGVTVPNTKTVSNTSKVSFNNPISDGAVSRAFSDGSKPIEVKGFNVWTTLIKGVGINAKKGASVLAAAEGKVTEVASGDEFVGNYVVISHPNGMKTVYTNLDPQISVKKNDVVKAKQVIGKVGDSARMLKFESYAESLGFQLLDSKDQQVDPSKYIKFN